jgi:hypothetical protein
MGRRDERDRRGRARVILYQDADFRGAFVVFYPGEELSNLRDAVLENGFSMNDEVSSIRIDGDVAVELYADARFRGSSLRVQKDVRDLSRIPLGETVRGSWNDRISSIRVVRNRDGGDGPNPGPGPRPSPPPADPERIIKAVFVDLVGRPADAGERRDFARRIVDEGWDERMLRNHLQQDRRYRGEIAEHWVRRAYREVLQRDPDPSGLDFYRRRVLDRGWSEADVRHALRQSDEFKGRR